MRESCFDDTGSVIRVEDLRKDFHVYHKPHHRLLQSILRNKKQFFSRFRALNGVSFTISKGEVVGILGRNGSGKSTLLQIVCGTMSHSEGSVEVNGRVAALLELGTGFNPEFSGRENVYINGALLGLSRSQIDQKFESIVDFSEIQDFIDQPVKTYSSGMLLRLAFSVAVCSEPEILVVDEALSVGDERFQRKCFARIESIKNSGSTILFVSHSASTILELCDRAILLDQGELLFLGQPKKALAVYQKILYAPPAKHETIKHQIKSGDLDSIEPEELELTEDLTNIVKAEESFDENLISTSVIEFAELGAKISEISILNAEERRVNCLVRGRKYLFRYEVKFSKSYPSARFGMMIKNVSGVEYGGYVTAQEFHGLSVSDGERVLQEFEFTCSLNPGIYYLNAGVLALSDSGEEFAHRIVDAYVFRVGVDVGALGTGNIDFGCSSTTRKIVN